MQSPDALPILVPLVVYVSLCFLPQGRRALIGIGVAAAVCLAFALADPAMRNLAVLAAAGVALAALQQGGRAVLGKRLRPGGYLLLVGVPIVVVIATRIAAAGA